MTITPGDVWIASILFTNRSGSKKRPVLILWLDAQDAIAAAVTPGHPGRTRLLLLLELGIQVIAIDGKSVKGSYDRESVLNLTKSNFSKSVESGDNKGVESESR